MGGVDHYVIWCSDHRDGLVRENERLVMFPSLVELRAYAVQHGLQLQRAEVARYDWDSIARWCDEPSATGIAAGPFLNTSNMAVDALPTSAELSLSSQADGRNRALYDKPFRANNLPAMTPPGAESSPV